MTVRQRPGITKSSMPPSTAKLATSHTVVISPRHSRSRAAAARRPVRRTRLVDDADRHRPQQESDELDHQPGGRQPEQQRHQRVDRPASSRTSSVAQHRDHDARGSEGQQPGRVAPVLLPGLPEHPGQGVPGRRAGNGPAASCGSVHCGFTGSPRRRRRYGRPGGRLGSTARILPPIPGKPNRNTTTRIQYFTGSAMTSTSATGASGSASARARATRRQPQVRNAFCAGAAAGRTVSVARSSGRPSRMR